MKKSIKLYDFGIVIWSIGVIAMMVLMAHNQGCVFSAKEIYIDPDNGLTHTEVIENAEK